MKNYKLTLAYDGSRYKGWQRLGAGELTIQDTLEESMKKILRSPVRIQGSGRTDAGVHARGQVANAKVQFQKGRELSVTELQAEMNHILPEDIRVLSIEEVSADFHARYSAVSKTYSFYVDTNEKPNVFERKYYYHFPYEIDVEKMKAAALHLEGIHDFSAFTDDKAEEKDRIRSIYSICIEEKNDRIHFQYKGNGFLQHMVRIMTGTILEVGRGDRSPEEMKYILEKGKREFAGFLVPAKGLFLDKVEYESKR